jgi:hypothetical protein
MKCTFVSPAFLFVAVQIKSLLLKTTEQLHKTRGYESTQLTAEEQNSYRVDPWNICWVTLRHITW